jgi:acylphosphatase
MEATPIVRHFLVRGRVQGVGFRWFVHREASELGLRGWVRNTDEGDVELVVAGADHALTELRYALDRGPRGSRVDRVHEHTLAPSEADGLPSFRIEGAW